MKPVNFKDSLNRAVWTAVQSACAVFVVTDLSTAKAAAVAVAGAVLAAVKSFAAAQLAK
jgi:hypothetical protein|tara:strand:- start:4305 stop:4481 length:177 start_codon:yes stop_codon:yes gene_type:complete